MFRNLMIMLALAFTALSAAAQTPVEGVIEKYQDVEGARSFIATGTRLALAKGLIRRTQVGILADDVDELAVLKMQNASQYSQIKFKHDLRDALESYEYHGTHDSRNGTVDIYVLRARSGSIEELVIYNPAILSLNSLRGTFPEQSLMELEEGS